jgi:hypothetical protein
MTAAGQRLILCAGPQSSGSTLVSWSFLQRADTQGILDMENDVLRTSFEHFRAPVTWCKMTVGAFRWAEVAGLYSDLGHEIVPLLVVRDLRDVLASLITKEYGFNGVSAEEPPLRIRLCRFLADWQLFRVCGWPMVRYESLVDQPGATLRRACDDLGLPWDDAMMSWPKPAAEILIPGRPGYNSTFTATRGAESLEAAIVRWRRHADTGPPRLPEAELTWLESTFAEFNEVCRYPARCSRDRAWPGGLPPPAYRDGPRRLARISTQEVEGNLSAVNASGIARLTC